MKVVAVIIGMMQSLAVCLCLVVSFCLSVSVFDCLCFSVSSVLQMFVGWLGEELSWTKYWTNNDLYQERTFGGRTNLA